MYSSKIIFSDAFKELGLKIGFIDAGARGDLPDPWKYLDESLLDIVGFEPDGEECEKLKKSFPNRKYFPFALWNEKKRVGIHLNQIASTSSVFPTNESIAPFFDHHHFFGRKTIKKVEVDGVRLDDVLDASWKGDFFKIDTQGSERMILEGARNFIASSKPVIITEAWNVDFYLGAPSAGAIISLMEEYGYFVLDMEITSSCLYENSQKSWLGSKPRATGVDLVFFPKFDLIAKMDNGTVIKRAAILELFGYRDLAVCLLEKIQQGKSDILNNVIHKMIANAKVETSFINKLKRRLSLLMGKKRTHHAPIHD